MQSARRSLQEKSAIVSVCVCVYRFWKTRTRKKLEQDRRGRIQPAMFTVLVYVFISGADGARDDAYNVLESTVCRGRLHSVYLPQSAEEAYTITRRTGRVSEFYRNVLKGGPSLDNFRIIRTCYLHKLHVRTIERTTRVSTDTKLLCVRFLSWLKAHAWSVSPLSPNCGCKPQACLSPDSRIEI